MAIDGNRWQRRGAIDGNAGRAIDGNAGGQDGLCGVGQSVRGHWA
jgi:hypothetical protein